MSTMLRSPSTMNFGNEDIDLDQIRNTLIRLEDTIIYLLIERAQFAHNSPIYEISDKFIELHQDQKTTFLDYILRQTENVHAQVRRYEAPDEYPFTPIQDLPSSILPPFKYPIFLHPNSINVNKHIKHFYINHIVEPLTQSADDGHYGSSAVIDVEVLQAVSRRIHYGKFVAECKFRDHPTDYIGPIRARDATTLEKLITKPAVEAVLIHRLGTKARMYGTEVDVAGNPIGESKMDAEVVVKMYRDWVIPLTRQVEVEYLLCRLDGLSQDEIEGLIKKKEKSLQPPPLK